MDTPDGRRQVRPTLGIQPGAVVRLAEQLKRVPQVFPRSFRECATTGPATPVSTAALLRTTAPIHLGAPLHWRPRHRRPPGRCAPIDTATPIP